MGHMKDLLITIYGGGDEAVEAACELAGIAKERRAYSDITDIVTVLRSVGFAAVEPSAGVSASLLHYCVTHAADEIERLRRLSANGDFPVPDNAANRDNTPATHATPSQGSVQSECTLTDAEREAVQWAAAMEPEPNGRWTKAQEKTWNKRAATLRGLLERME